MEVMDDKKVEEAEVGDEKPPASGAKRRAAPVDKLSKSPAADRLAPISGQAIMKSPVSAPSATVSCFPLPLPPPLLHCCVRSCSVRLYPIIKYVEIRVFFPKRIIRTELL